MHASSRSTQASASGSMASSTMTVWPLAGGRPHQRALVGRHQRAEPRRLAAEHADIGHGKAEPHQLRCRCALRQRARMRLVSSRRTTPPSGPA